MPAIGDKVHIRPALAHCPKDTGPDAPSSVLAAPSGRFLAVGGEDVTWSAHHAERLKHGEIVIDPAPVEVK